MPNRSLKSANEAVTLLKPLFDRSPVTTRHWLAFSKRTTAEAELSLGSMESGGKNARAAVDLWTEVARERVDFETENAIKASKTLIRYLVMVGDRPDPLQHLDEIFALRGNAILRGSEKLKGVVREMIAIAVDFAGAEAQQRVPDNIRDYVAAPQ